MVSLNRKLHMITSSYISTSNQNLIYRDEFPFVKIILNSNYKNKITYIKNIANDVS